MTPTEGQPTVLHVNQILDGVDHWTSHLGYGKEYVKRGPNAGRTGNAAMVKYDMRSGTMRVWVDVDEKWNWNIRATVTDLKGDEEFSETIHTQSSSLSQVGSEVKEKLLKNLPRAVQIPITVEGLFRNNLLASTVFLVEKEYNEIFE